LNGRKDTPAGSGRRGVLLHHSWLLSAPNRNVTTPAMDRRDDARTAELNNLRLALAAFALQLAALEMRLHLTSFDIRKSGRPLRAGAGPGLPAPPPDINCSTQKERLIGGQ
jgi:hypothetical protein